MLRRGKGEEEEEEEEVECARKKSVNPLEIVHNSNFPFLFFFLTKYENLNKPNTAFTLLGVPINIGCHHYFWPGLIAVLKNTLPI